MRAGRQEYWEDRRTAPRRAYKRAEEVVQLRAYPRGYVESAYTQNLLKTFLWHKIFTCILPQDSHSTKCFSSWQNMH